MITKVKLELNISFNPCFYTVNFFVELENSFEKEISLCETDYNYFAEHHIDSVFHNDFDYFWCLGKEISESCKVPFSGYLKCEDELTCLQYDLLKSQVEKLNEKYNTEIGFIA